MQLNLNNYDVTNLTLTDGSQGLFMGIGFPRANVNANDSDT